LKFLLFILLSISLYANILTNYRTNGIQNIEKEMDLELSSKRYWSKQIKDIDTTFGYFESYSSILTCNKTESSLSLYIKNSNNLYKLQKKYEAYTGQNQGDKLREGDLKTPVGVYDLTKKISKLDSFYGPLAFVTSYPNTYDTYRGKNGSGIWIHGLPQESRDEFTKGCIAIENSDIESLDKNIMIDKTLLIISQDKVKKELSKETVVSILSFLYKWRYAWLYGDIKGYLEFYSLDFIRFDGMNFNKFKKYKTRIFKKIEKKTIIFNNINITPYPDTSNIYQIIFKEFYKSNSFKFIGNKTLIVKIENNNIKILTEK